MRIEGVYVKHLIDEFLMIIYLKRIFKKYPIILVVWESWLVVVLPFIVRGFPGGSEVKASAYNAGDLGSIPGLGRSPGEGNGNPLQYSCLENPIQPCISWINLTCSWCIIILKYCSVRLKIFC